MNVTSSNWTTVQSTGGWEFDYMPGAYSNLCLWHAPRAPLHTAHVRIDVDEAGSLAEHLWT